MNERNVIVNVSVSRGKFPTVIASYYQRDLNLRLGLEQTFDQTADECADPLVRKQSDRTRPGFLR